MCHCWSRLCASLLMHLDLSPLKMLLPCTRHLTLVIWQRTSQKRRDTIIPSKATHSTWLAIYTSPKHESSPNIKPVEQNRANSSCHQYHPPISNRRPRLRISVLSRWTLRHPPMFHIRRDIWQRRHIHILQGSQVSRFRGNCAYTLHSSNEHVSDKVLIVAWILKDSIPTRPLQTSRRILPPRPIRIWSSVVPNRATTHDERTVFRSPIDPQKLVHDAHRSRIEQKQICAQGFQDPRWICWHTVGSDFVDRVWTRSWRRWLSVGRWTSEVYYLKLDFGFGLFTIIIM